MSIILTDGDAVLTLPGDLEWTDEYAWTPVEQESGYSLTGALIVEQSVKQAGRPVTLQGAEDRAWIRRADVDRLHAWVALPGLQLTLTLRGSERAVIFRRDSAPVEAQMVMFYGNPIPDDLYVVTIRLMEV